MYGNDPAVGLYTIPLIIWHTIQLVIGTALMARLAKFVDDELTSSTDSSVEDDAEQDAEKGSVHRESNDVTVAEGTQRESRD